MTGKVNQYSEASGVNLAEAAGIEAAECATTARPYSLHS